MPPDPPRGSGLRPSVLQGTCLLTSQCPSTSKVNENPADVVGVLILSSTRMILIACKRAYGGIDCLGHSKITVSLMKHSHIRPTHPSRQFFLRSNSMHMDSSQANKSGVVARPSRCFLSSGTYSLYCVS